MGMGNGNGEWGMGNGEWGIKTRLLDFELLAKMVLHWRLVRAN
jgi:hypothetical protein